MLRGAHSSIERSESKPGPCAISRSCIVANQNDSIRVQGATSDLSAIMSGLSPLVIRGKNGGCSEVKEPLARNEGFLISLPAGSHDEKGLPETSKAHNAISARHHTKPLRCIFQPAHFPNHSLPPTPQFPHFPITAATAADQPPPAGTMRTMRSPSIR